MLVFTRRDRQEAIKSIIEKPTDIDDKTRRIMSLDFEYRNSEVCDTEIVVGKDISAVVQKIVSLVNQK